MIDISKLQADERATFKVYVQGAALPDGTDEADSAGFVVVGPHSAEFRKSQARLGAKVIALLRETDGKKEAETLSDEEDWVKRDAAVTERARVVAESCTLDWFGFVNSGVPVSFSAQALGSVLTSRPLWAFAIMRAVENEANFTRP